LYVDLAKGQCDLACKALRNNSGVMGPQNAIKTGVGRGWLHRTRG
jgi:hypothetical protein